VLKLNSQSNDFDKKFDRLLNISRDVALDVSDVVSDIISAVRKNGDEALIEFSAKFDRVELTAQNIHFSEKEIKQAVNDTKKDVIKALEFAYERIYSHHERQMPKNDIYQDDIGVILGSRWSAVQSAGLYVPGGLASYPSSVLMNAIPAKVAGVKRLAMVVPTPNGEVNPAVLAAANIAGIDEIYKVGGAQAIGALAYGTKSIAPVNKIVGPGNAYVAEAKRQVFGIVGIDMIAGPSEILVIADESANPAWVAADLLAQAEHGSSAQSIVFTTSEKLALQIESEVEKQVKLLSRSEIAKEGWDKFGAIIVVSSLQEAFDLSNLLAPEHLELALDEPQLYLDKITNAGAIFLGHHTPEAIGDYVGGSNHVLPTSRSARFASGLSVLDFVKRTSLLGCNPSNLSLLSDASIKLAKTEGLDGHARSVSIRLNR
jgi:histidinol dehydrogenase